MFTEHRAVVALRVFLVVLFAVLLVLQTLSLPGQFAHMAKESPDLAYLRWPLTAVTVFWVVCVQMVVVATWKLLSMVKAGRIFSDDAFAWVDTILGAVAAAWAVLLGVFLYVGIKASDPGLPLLLFLLLVGVAV